MDDNYVNFFAVSRMEEFIDEFPGGFGFDSDNLPTFCGERIAVNVLRYLSDRSRCKIDPAYREFGYTGEPEDLVDDVDWEYENSRPPQ